jgi:hypothetical protein
MIMKRLSLTMVDSPADRCIDLNDHGQLRGDGDPVGGGSGLAVVVTVAKGYDLAYIWKTKWAKLHLMQHRVRGPERAGMA